MFEQRHESVASRWVFALRLIGAAFIALAVVIASLVVGILGYHYFEGMNWIDSFANAAMILSGMGPLNPLHSDSGKVFAGVYALYSGLAIVTATGITITPIVHRFLHHLHADEQDIEERTHA